MRHFIVLGFATASTKEAGEVLYVGTDRGAGIAAVNETDSDHRRRELYELATPHIRRTTSKLVSAKAAVSEIAKAATTKQK